VRNFLRGWQGWQGWGGGGRESRRVGIDILVTNGTIRLKCRMQANNSFPAHCMHRFVYQINSFSIASTNTVFCIFQSQQTFFNLIEVCSGLLLEPSSKLIQYPPRCLPTYETKVPLGLALLSPQ
jgi:hypothetical protein